MIIGVTGWFASGKDIVCDHLVKKGYVKISLSDIIREQCTKENLPHTRDNLREMGNTLRDKYGSDYLAQEALRRINKSKNDKSYVIPSIRQPAEAKIFRQSPNFQLWEIFAPARIRYERLIKRARSDDEKKITFKEFIIKEKAEMGDRPNCQQIDKVIKLADKQINNSGTVEDLYKQIDIILREYGKEK